MSDLSDQKNDRLPFASILYYFFPMWVAPMRSQIVTPFVNSKGPHTNHGPKLLSKSLLNYTKTKGQIKDIGVGDCKLEVN